MFPPQSWCFSTHLVNRKPWTCWPSWHGWSKSFSEESKVMAKSIASRIEDIRRALEAQTEEPVTIAIDLVTATTRDEATALLGLPPTPAPDCPAVRLVPEHITAAEYLRGRGIEPQQTEGTER
jgi:hypothetical protein